MRLPLESILAKSLFLQSVVAVRGPGGSTAHCRGTVGLSRDSAFVVALLLAGLMLTSGCQTPLVAPQTVLTEVTSKADQPAATSPLLGSLERRLAVDHWRIRPDWSPLNSTTNMRRWELVDAGDLPVPSKASSEESPPETRPGETVAAANDTPSDAVPDGKPSLSEDGLEAKERPASLGVFLNNLSSGLETSAGMSVSAKGGDVTAALLEQLTSREDLVGWNATILLAQRSPKKAIRHVETLQRLVEAPPSISQVSPPAEESEDKNVGPTETDSADKSISVWMRAAAAEAWCLALAAIPQDSRKALSPAGELLVVPDLPEEIREELLLALSETIPPLEVPGLADAFRRTADQPTAPVRLRRVAMQACILYAIHNVATDRDITDQERRAAGSGDGPDRTSAADSIELWPASIWNCQTDPDSTVRQEFGLWVSLLRHDEALGVLESQLWDTDFRVRDAALANLGRLGNEQALELLKAASQRDEEQVRKAAVAGLAYFEPEDVLALQSDVSHHVRAAVAAELKRWPTPDVVFALRRFLTDRNPQVQEAAVEAVRNWDDVLAVPLLLHSFRESFRGTRVKAVTQLSKRIGKTGPLAVDAPAEERTAIARRLAVELHLPVTALADLMESRPVTTVGHASDRQEELDQVIEDWQQAAGNGAVKEKLIAELGELSPKNVRYLERRLAEADAEPRAALSELLSTVSVAYAAIEKLRSGDVVTRRRGAADLNQASRSATLSPAVVNQLREFLVYEQDNLVWTHTMAAVFEDASDEAAQLALLAVNHTWPDIRVLGCRHLERHGRSSTASWLVPLFHDRNRRVQLAAIEAAGHCNNPVVLDGVVREGSGERLPGLRTLLGHSSSDVRFAAIVAMNRLGDMQGQQELIRLGFHGEPGVRMAVAREMGAQGQTRFIEYLVRLGWTEQNQAVQQAVLDSLAQLVPADQRPTGLDQNESNQERIQSWVDWYRRRQAS